MNQRTIKCHICGCTHLLTDDYAPFDDVRLAEILHTEIEDTVVVRTFESPEAMLAALAEEE